MTGMLDAKTMMAAAQQPAAPAALLGKSGWSAREAFDRIDVDRSGSISNAELARLKDRMSPGEAAPLLNMIKSLDADGDGVIGFGEFEVLWGPKLDAFCARQSRAVFDRIDMDGSGEISAVEMKGAMARLPAATQAQLWPVMKELDSNGSGVVEFPGFEVMLTSWIKQKLEKGLALALNPVKIGGWGSKQAFDHIDTDASGGM